MGTPCTDDYRNLYAATTRGTICDGHRATFWESPWVDGIHPKDIAPKIFDLSRKKRSSVRSSLTDNTWVRNIDTSQGLTFEHIEQFATLWEKLSNVILTPGVDDAIFLEVH